MADQTSSDNQVLQDELERAKETLSRLRCINGFTSTCPVTCNKFQGCQRHSHDVTLGKCSDRDGEYARAPSSMKWNGGGSFETSRRSEHSSRSRVSSRVSREDSGFSRADLQRLHGQIDSLEESVRGPIMSYIESMERRNIDMSDAVETIRRQLLKHERVCSAMGITSGSIRNGSESLANESDNVRGLRQTLGVNQRTERESRTRTEALEKELAACREKLEKSEVRVRDLFRSISQMQASGGAGNSEILLENQLRRQQQLTEAYFKESTSKDREISFLTIEKYNLESEVSSLVTDLESSNQKRDELLQEKRKLETMLQECHNQVVGLEQQLKKCKNENKRSKSEFRVVLEEERARGEKNSENQSEQEKQIKELRKKCKKYEEHRSSQKGIAQQLEAERNELLMKARSFKNEYQIKLSECNSLREENERLSKEISNSQVEASLSKTEYNNSKAYMESLKSELSEAKSSIKSLEYSLQESKVSESQCSAEISAFSHKEASLKLQIETSEKERSLVTKELEEAKKRETDSRSESTEIKEKLEQSQIEVQELSQNYTSLKTDLELTREKYFQLKKTNDELVLHKNDAEKSHGFTHEELTRLKAAYDELGEKNAQLSADLKAYKRIVAEKENQLKKNEQELAQLHKTKDKELKELLKKDKEIAFLKARVSSTERSSSRIMNRSDGGAGLDRFAASEQNPRKDTDIYLERIVELESECKAQKLQIDELLKSQHHAKKNAQRSDSLKQELASQDEEIQKLRREVSRSKQVIEELRDKEDQLESFREEKERLRQEVTRLQAKVEQVSELKQACEQKEEEMRALRRMSSEEADLEGKMSRLKDRCREKDEEIEELHQKVITLQVKVKDFMQQNSVVEEQIRSVKEKYSMELGEKEKISQALKAAETKCRTSEENLEATKIRCAALEKDLLETKRSVATLESEKDGMTQGIADLTTENKTKEDEVAQLRKQIKDLEESVKVDEEEVTRATEDLPDEASTPLENSLESPLRRSGRASAALDRLEVLEEENILLLNRQSELEDELDAAEEHAEELKNALKSKRDNVNDLHAELDLLKEKLKATEKVRAEMADEHEQLQQSYSLSQKKVEDLRIANDRYMEEADEVEKALTAAEIKIEELEKKLEEVSGKCASSEGQLQSVTERFARKEKELQVVETQVDEQRKLCDGYKASAEKQEALIEKLRVEKVSVEESFLAMKLEIAKKEGTYKSTKEKIAEMQARLYETEDKFSGKSNECKKLTRENERLKREIKELETKIAELQTMKKNRMSIEVEKTSSVYNPKLVSLNTSVKGNSHNVEGLDTKLNSAQSKISTLEVALANDLRKFSLHRSPSDVPRRGYSPNENQLSPSSASFRRPRSSSTTGDMVDDREGPRSRSRSVSPLPRAGSSASLSGDVEREERTIKTLDITKSQVEIKSESNSSEINVSEYRGEKEEEEGGNNSDGPNSEIETALFEADPFLSSKMVESIEKTGVSSDQAMDSLVSESLASEASAILLSTSAVDAQTLVQEETVTLVQETVTSSSVTVTGDTSTSTNAYSYQDFNGGEELIYF